MRAEEVSKGEEGPTVMAQAQAREGTRAEMACEHGRKWRMAQIEHRHRQRGSVCS